VKTDKLQVRQMENRILDDSETTDLFWKLFNNPQSAIAITNEDGDVLLSNELFSSIITKAPSPLNFSLLLKNRKTNLPRENHEFSIDTGNQIIKLTLLDAQNQYGHYLWIATPDAEVAIHHKAAILKNLYRSFIDTTFGLILRTSPDGKILFTNQLFLQSFGFERYYQVKSESIEMIFENPEQYRIAMETLSNERRLSEEIIFFRKVDGSRLTGKVNCNVHQDESGAPVFNWTLLDISNQVESENTLKASNEQLAKVNQQMEKFLYSTSHDLRSPITSILGLVNLVQMESKDPIVLDYMEKIESSTQKLDKVIQDIMSFSRSTYTRLKSERIDFEMLAWKTFNQYRNHSEIKKIHFEVKAGANFPFYSDIERLEIIFDNIIRNAIQFYDSNKSRSFIQVKIITQRDYAKIEFIDNGIGIAKQYLDSIFTMFYKASHTSKGAGLGLYIVKETLEKLEGTVSVESEIGFGTVLRVTIPNDHKGKLIDRKLQLINQS